MNAEMLYGSIGAVAALANLYGTEKGRSVWNSVVGRNAMRKEQTIALLLTERGKSEWRRLQSDTPPDGYVRVPIVDTIRTTIPNKSMAEIREQLRAGLSVSGRSAHDWRCVYWLHHLETGNYRAMWNFNTGNRKVRPLATEQSIREGFVYIKDTHANGVYGLIDRLRSFDLYASYPDFVAGLRGEETWMRANGYDAVLRAWTVGGIEGLADAIHAAATRGYWGTAARSPLAVRTRIANARAWWNRNANLYGEAWTR